MLVSRLKNLLRASFRGVTFSVRSESLTDGGRKVVLHEYPNSSERYVEDLGRIPPKFNVQAFVHGKDYQQRSRALEQALLRKGSGRLITPVYGSVDVYALPYQKDTSQLSIGEITFNLSFAVGKPAKAPTAALATKQTVFSKGDLARAELKTSTESVWKAATPAANKLSGGFDLRQLATDMLSTFATTALTSALTTITDIVDTIISKSNNIILSPAILSNSLSSLFDEVSLSQEDGTGYESATELFTWGNGLPLILSDVTNSSQIGDEVPLWDATTAERIARNSNRMALVDSVRISSLLVAYEQASSGSYKTEDQVITVREQLEQAFNDIITIPSSDRTRIAGTPAVRQGVESVRFSTLEVLSQLQQNSYQLLTIEDAKSLSFPMLTYMLYAEQLNTPSAFNDKVKTVKELNKGVSSIAINQQVNVLQETA